MEMHNDTIPYSYIASSASSIVSSYNIILLIIYFSIRNSMTIYYISVLVVMKGLLDFIIKNPSSYKCVQLLPH